MTHTIEAPAVLLQAVADALRGTPPEGVPLVRLPPVRAGVGAPEGTAGAATHCHVMLRVRADGGPYRRGDRLRLAPLVDEEPLVVAIVAVLDGTAELDASGDVLLALASLPPDEAP